MLLIFEKFLCKKIDELGACFGLYVKIIYYDEELKLQISRRALDVTLGVLCPFCIGGFLTNK